MKKIYQLAMLSIVALSSSMVNAKSVEPIAATSNVRVFYQGSNKVDMDQVYAGGDTRKVNRSIFGVKRPVFKSSTKKAASIGKYKDVDDL